MAVKTETISKNDYLGYIKNNHTQEKLVETLNHVDNLKVFVIGDTIIDQYAFVQEKGRAVKDPILSVEHLFEETYAGGILAVANHVANFTKNVHVVTLLGDTNSYENVIKELLNKYVTLYPLTKENSPTTVKRRYISHYRNTKLFKVEYINDRPINEELTSKILSILDKELEWCDMILVVDFGHGFINDAIRKKLEQSGKFLAVNAQSNSANMGYNYFNLYERTDFRSMNAEELRMPLAMRFEDIDVVIEEARRKYNMDKFLVTVGKNGCIYCHEGKIFKAPGFNDNVKDTVGAGDALFAICSLLVFKGVTSELIPFYVNCVGGIASNIEGNKYSVTQEMIKEYIDSLLK